MQRSTPPIARRFLAGAILVALGAAASRATAQSAPPATTGSGTLSGHFQVIWGDPRSERDEDAKKIFALFGDDGRVTVLEMDDAQAARFGGVAAMSGRRVSLAGDLAAAPASGGAPTLRVRAVQSVEAPPGLARSSRVTAMAARAAASVSSRPYVTVLCKFPDFPDSMPGGDRNRFATMISGAFPSVDNFWRENSEERVNLAGSVVVGWYTLPQPRSYYVQNNNANLARLADDCTGAADADVHFPSYSGINLQFNTTLDCCSWGGGFGVNRDGVNRVYPMTWEASWAAYAMGTWAHEVGHSFGLPHSSGPYGRTYDSRWDVMSSSSWYKPAGSSVSYGTHTVAYHKDMLGWVPAERKFLATAPEARIAIERSALPGDNANYQMAQIPIASAPGQFYTVEVRRRIGYDLPLPGDAVLITRVDPERGEPSQVVDPDGNGNTNDAGAMWTVGETFLDRANDVRISVDSAVGNAFYVTIVQGRVLALSRTGGRAALVAGSGATAADTVGVRLQSAGAWRASGRAGWSAIATPTGIGDGPLRWERRVAGMGPGRYVDTITVTATSGAAGSPAMYLDTLEVLAAPALTAGLSAPGRADSAVAATRTDSVLVRPSGPGAADAAWSATTAAGWITMLAASGTGDGVVKWTWSTTTIAPGLYVDTIRVALAGGGPAALFVDSLRVLPAAVVQSSARSHRVTSGLGSLPYADSTKIDFNDRWSTGAAWQASSKWLQPWRFIRVVTPGGVGNGFVSYVRDAGSLAPGTYVDTLFIQGAFVARTAVVVDTLTVAAGPVALALADSSRADSVVVGLTQSSDSVQVYLTGTGASALAWTTVSRRGYVTLMSQDAFSPIGGGTGSGRLRWMRKPAGLAPGMYVDTLVVTAGPLTASVVDTMLVYPLFDLALDASAKPAVGRRAEVPVGARTARSDSAAVRLVYHGGGGAATWTATSRRPWTRVATPAGAAGEGFVRWTRDPSSLAVGTYVDTIALAATGRDGGASVRIVDTLAVLPTLAVAVDGATTASRHVQALAGFAAGLRDSAPLAFTGYGAATVAWTAAATRPWLRLSPASGTGAGFVRWERTAGSLPAGTHVDTITIQTTESGVVARIVDSFTVVTAPSATEAAEELLGTPRLSAVVRQLVDRMGNGDGVYNLGDFLAYLDRTGTQVSAALMAEVLARSGDSAPGARHTAVPRDAQSPTKSSPDIKP